MIITVTIKHAAHLLARCAVNRRIDLRPILLRLKVPLKLAPRFLGVLTSGVFPLAAVSSDFRPHFLELPRSYPALGDVADHAPNGCQTIPSRSGSRCAPAATRMLERTGWLAYTAHNRDRHSVAHGSEGHLLVSI